MGDTEDIPVYNVGEELITEPTDMDTHTPDMDTDTTSARDLLMLNQKPTPAQTHGTVMEVTDMAVDTDTVMAVDTVMVTHIGMVVTTDVVTTDTANKHHQKFQNQHCLLNAKPIFQNLPIMSFGLICLIFGMNL